MKIISSLFAISDEQAMWRVQTQDDAQAFAQLVNRWEGPVRRLCLRMLGDEHKAEDLTQEAFARIYAKRRDFQNGCKFSTFLWRVATNLCLDELRRIKRRRELTLLPDPAGGGDSDLWENLPSDGAAPDSATLAEERSAMVKEAVTQLPEHYRVVVVLRHYENLKFREIAEVLNVPEGTVKSRMSEALSILHRALKRSLEIPSASRANRGRRDTTQEALVL